MRPHLATPDEKETTQSYTSAGPGVTEIERPWCLQPVYQPDPRAVIRHHPMLPPQRGARRADSLTCTVLPPGLKGAGEGSAI